MRLLGLQPDQLARRAPPAPKPPVRAGAGGPASPGSAAATVRTSSPMRPMLPRKPESAAGTRRHDADVPPIRGVRPRGAGWRHRSSRARRRLPCHATAPLGQDVADVGVAQGVGEVLLDEHDRLARRRAGAAICSKSCSTTSGARPIESSSTSTTWGRPTRARHRASICCSPPDSDPAGCSRRSAEAREHRRRSRSSHVGPRAGAPRAAPSGGRCARFSSTVSDGNTPRPSGTSARPAAGDVGRATAVDAARRRGGTAPEVTGQRAGDGPQRRGLAGAVGPEHRHDRARRAR